MRLYILIASLWLAITHTVFANTLSVDDFGQLPDVRQVILSADGKKLASIVRVDLPNQKGQAVQVLDISTKKSELLLFTDNTSMFLSTLFWKDNKTLLANVYSPTERIIPGYNFGTNRRVTAREIYLLSINTETKKVSEIFSKQFLSKFVYLPVNRASIVDTLRNDPDHILMQMASMHYDYPSGPPLVYKVNINTQKASVYHQSQPNIYRWMTDYEQVIRAGAGNDRKGNRYITVKDPSSGKWKDLWHHKTFSQDAVSFVAFDKDPNIIYIRAYNGNYLAIFKVNITDPELKRELFFSLANQDVEGNLIIDYEKKSIIGITNGDKGNIYFDDTLKGIQEKLNKALPDNINRIQTVTDDKSAFLLYSESSIESGTYYLGNINPLKVDAVAYGYKKLIPNLLNKTKEITYTTRDGMKITGYLTLPKNTSGKKLPTIIHPHGGPQSRDYYGFDYWQQFFANKGYAVLQMNFRGSTGSGFDHMNAGLKSWGEEMQDDIEDGVHYLVKEGITDASRVAIVGASYGGYAALMGAVKTPDLFQCAVSVNGVSNVFDLVKDHRRYWRAYNVVDEQIGNDNAHLRSISPVNFPEKIKVPVLLIHGTEDRQVEIKHSQQMFDALSKAKKDVEFIELPNDDHYLSSEENRLLAFRTMDKFLDRCLPIK
jgi:dipeptidyl aminopeptidase/acylaminoacyl peptidase